MSEPPLRATIPLPVRLSFSMTVITLPYAIAVGISCSKGGRFVPVGEVCPGLLRAGTVTDETYSNHAIIYYPGRAVEIADLFHCE